MAGGAGGGGIAAFAVAGEGGEAAGGFDAADAAGGVEEVRNIGRREGEGVGLKGLRLGGAFAFFDAVGGLSGGKSGDTALLRGQGGNEQE